MHKYSHAFLIAAAVSVAACTGSDGASDVAGPTYDWGQLVVDVKVNGDPASSTRGFALVVDHEYADSVTLNGRRSFTVLAGEHQISIAPEAQNDFFDFFDLGLPSWCSVSERNPSVVRVAKDSTSAVVMEVDCPPLAGSARIRIHAAAIGPNAPAEVNYLVERVHPPQQDRSSSSMRIPVSGFQELNDVPGIYLIVPVDPSGKCDSWFEDFLGWVFVPRSAGYVLVRDAQVVDVNNALNCP